MVPKRPTGQPGNNIRPPLYHRILISELFRRKEKQFYTQLLLLASKGVCGVLDNNRSRQIELNSTMANSYSALKYEITILFNFNNNKKIIYKEQKKNNFLQYSLLLESRIAILIQLKNVII